MVDAGHLEGAGCYAQGRVLYSLQDGDDWGGDVREKHWRSIYKDGFDQHLISEQKDLLRLSPARIGLGLEKAKAGGGSVSHYPDVGGKGEMGVESDSQDLGWLAEGEGVVIGRHW